jgi:leader peptidase (prepilin peptidase) / N-methyltransferase
MMILESMLPIPAGLGPWSLAALTFAVGACIGSFLNVCIYRLPEDESVVWPGSRCPRCQHEIAWYDNLPIVSWLILRARCRNCAAPIAARYPLVELLTGAFALAALVRFGATPQAFVAFAFSAALLTVTFIDLDHFIIPDEVSLPGILVGLAVSLLPGGIGLLDAFGGTVFGGGILWLVAWAYEQVTGTEGMGFGDVKLLAMIGAFLGWQAIPMVLVVASVIGSFAGILAIFTPAGLARLRRVRRRLGPKAVAPYLRRAARTTAIPFGPFLALGALLLLFVPGLGLPFDWVALG